MHLFSENPQNQVLHVSNEKSDIKDRKLIPSATFQAYIIFEKTFEPSHSISLIERPRELHGRD